MSYVQYSSNNSGGHWWLKDEHWHALEKAGWVIHWTWLREVYKDALLDGRGVPTLTDVPEENPRFQSLSKDIGVVGARWLGALAREAYKPNCDSLREAADEWERVTGQSALDAGCACCGPPHSFTLYDGQGKYVESGPSTNYSASW